MKLLKKLRVKQNPDLFSKWSSAAKIVKSGPLQIAIAEFDEENYKDSRNARQEQK